jgi:hypothetical protein
MALEGNIRDRDGGAERSPYSRYVEDGPIDLVR